MALTPDGSKVYVTNFASNTLSAINTATNTGERHDPCRRRSHRHLYTATAEVRRVPGSTNCRGTSVSALATEFGDLAAAAAALGFSTAVPHGNECENEAGKAEPGAEIAGCHSGIFCGIAVGGPQEELSVPALLAVSF